MPENREKLGDVAIKNAMIVYYTPTQEVLAQIQTEREREREGGGFRI